MKKRRKGRKKEKPTSTNKGFSQFILQIFYENPLKPLALKQVCQILGVRDRKSRNKVEKTLEKLVADGKLNQLRGNRFRLDQDPEFIVGYVDYVNSGFAYIETPEGEEDIWVHTRNMSNALDGDQVRVELITQPRSNRRAEGRVVDILKRERNQFVGKVQLNPNYAFVVPDFRKMHVDIFVYPENLKGARENDKVIVEVTKWHLESGNKSPVGKVIEVLGKAGENEAEIHSIIAEFGLPNRFPAKVDKSASKISGEIGSKEIKGRKDFREITTFTIDPEDAKDFDDALSYRKIKDDRFEIGIHIADVTHYVDQDSEIEKEAFERATSVYLVDRTIPMLPERLSNELCSLRPHEDKLTFSAVFEIDRIGKIHHQWFGRTVIHSDRRFTYEEAQEILDAGKGEYSEELLSLNHLAKELKRIRFDEGAIAFETVEIKFVLDEKGVPLAVKPKVRKDAHKLIEEFMLLANRRVAEHIFGLKKGGEKNTFVYRVHDDPDPEKLNNFSNFARKFGHKLDLNRGNISNSLNHLMNDIEGKPEQNVLESVAIRTMAKAKYTTESRGHFGLAFPHYTHFTSPIRRYPDVMVHRLLQHYLDGGKPPDRELYEDHCLHSSEREKRASDAERASIKYKQVEFMNLAEDKDYEGIVSGLTEWGVFVEIIETRCEGMVRISEMIDDYYDFDEDNFRIIGRRTKRIITLGDKVVVRVVGTDIDRRTIDLELVD